MLKVEIFAYIYWRSASRLALRCCKIRADDEQTCKFAWKFGRASGGEKRDLEESEHASTRAAQLLSSIKRRKSQRALAALTHGPGGGAMEWPPLIHRDHHSVHGGMEYYQ